MVDSYIIKIIMIKFNLNIKIISFELNVKNKKKFQMFSTININVVK